MGYRSSIYFEIPAEKYGLFLDTLKECIEAEFSEYPNEQLDNVVKLMDGMRQDQFPDKRIYFMDYCKWYTEDFEIRMLNQALAETPECTFIRTGEDEADVEWTDTLGSSHYVRCASVSCAATEDALDNALSYLSYMEQAHPAVRKKAISELTGVLNKLLGAEGLREMEDAGGFWENE